MQRKWVQTIVYRRLQSYLHFYLDFFLRQGVLNESPGSAERHTWSTFKHTRTVAALRRHGSSLNPHFRTESLLRFNLKNITSHVSVLTFWEVDETFFSRHLVTICAVLVAPKKKKKKEKHWLNVLVVLKVFAFIRIHWNYTHIQTLQTAVASTPRQPHLSSFLIQTWRGAFQSLHR